MQNTTSWALTITTDAPFSLTARGVFLGSRQLGEITRHGDEWTACGVNAGGSFTRPLADPEPSPLAALVHFADIAEDVVETERRYHEANAAYRADRIARGVIR